MFYPPAIFPGCRGGQEVDVLEDVEWERDDGVAGSEDLLFLSVDRDPTVGLDHLRNRRG